MNISKREVKLAGGQEIIACLMENDNGMKVEVLNLGGIITKILIKDANGVIENVVLEYDDWNAYLTNPIYLGALIGRTAGRINKSTVTINNKIYEFSKNQQDHNLHGGQKGFDKKIWDVKTYVNDENCTVQLHYLSKDQEENYPGNLDVYVNYILNNKNELIIKYEATSDADTLVNLTNHSYFNLSGNAKHSVLEHQLLINSESFCELDENLIPTGQLLKVKEHDAFDFQGSKEIGKDIEQSDRQLTIGSGYDHPFVLTKSLPHAALFDPISKRTMQIITTEPCVVFYSMNFADEHNKLSNGQLQGKRYAVCLETQKLPIGQNEVFKEDSILKEGETYLQETTYKFGIKE